MNITASEFEENIGHYQDAAQLEPVTITRNGQAHTVLLSAHAFELMTKDRVARYVEDLDPATLQAIADAEVPPEFDALDDVLVSSPESVIDRS